MSRNIDLTSITLDTVSGTLELVVTTAKTSVRAEVSARSRGLYDVTFVPSDTLAHFINITFNEQHIRDSPFKCDVVSGVTGGGDVREDSVVAAAAAVNGTMQDMEQQVGVNKIIMLCGA